MTMAAAHVTGFAAVLLAHHPLFQGIYRTRGEHRVAALFEIIRPSTDPSRAATALSDLQRAPEWWMLPALQAGQAAAEVGSGSSSFVNAIPQPWQQAGLAATSAYLASPVMVQLRAMGMI